MGDREQHPVKKSKGAGNGISGNGVGGFPTVPDLAPDSGIQASNVQILGSCGHGDCETLLVLR